MASTAWVFSLLDWVQEMFIVVALAGLAVLDEIEFYQQLNLVNDMLGKVGTMAKVVVNLRELRKFLCNDCKQQESDAWCLARSQQVYFLERRVHLFHLLSKECVPFDQMKMALDPKIYLGDSEFTNTAVNLDTVEFLQQGKEAKQRKAGCATNGSPNITTTTPFAAAFAKLHQQRDVSTSGLLRKVGKLKA